MKICQSLNIKDFPCTISLIGAGGKSTTMFSLADEFNKQGKKVLVTTTTHISIDQGNLAQKLITESKYNIAVKKLKEYFQECNVICLNTSILEEQQKLKGIPIQWIERIKNENIVDIIIVEADGAKGKSFKAPTEYEPVLPKHNDIIVAIMGTDAMYKPIIDQYVHRPERILALLNGEPENQETILSKENIIRVYFHKSGLLKDVQKDQKVYILLNKVNKTREMDALQLANQMIQKSDFGNLKVLIGNVQNSLHPITHIID